MSIHTPNCQIIVIKKLIKNKNVARVTKSYEKYYMLKMMIKNMPTNFAKSRRPLD